MKVAVTGAGGLIGRGIVPALLARGDHVVALSRHPDALAFPPEVEHRHFNPSASHTQPGAFEGVDAIVHLAGETVAGRWTQAKKRAIESSRVDGTRLLVQSLAANVSKPHVLVSASAVGYYGSRGNEQLRESSLPGDDFLAQVCQRWEAAAHEAEALRIRTVVMRTGIVLAHGGALAAMMMPFRFGLGGPLGSGRGFVPWIHIDDVVAMYLFALDNDVRGPFNAVAPDYATSARFAKALGKALHRPALLPAPAFALRAILGEFADTILASQFVVPERADKAGFAWEYPQLEEALEQIVRSSKRPEPAHQ